MLIDIRSYNDHKIHQIKALRTATGLGLKEAKDIVDALQNGGRPISVKIIPNLPSDIMRDFNTLFTSEQEASDMEINARFHYRAEVRKLAIMAIEADDLSAAKELLSLFA